MPSSNKENQRIKTRSSSSISRSGQPTNNSSTSNGPSSSTLLSTVATSQQNHHHHHHHRHQPAAEHTVRPLGKTKNSKIYFSDSDDDNGQQTTTPPKTIKDKNNRQLEQSLQQQQYQYESAANFPSSAKQQYHARPTLGAAAAAAAAATAFDELNSGQSTDNDQTVNALLIISKHRRNTSNKKNMIIHYGREFICVLALILTTYATFQNVPPKISKIAAPKPFFPKGSLVHDHPGGHLDHVQNNVVQSELSLVMFYAPWCAESQYARATYEYVARRFYRQAHFAAINCWQPGGECRHQYAKILEWPVVMAYLQNGLAVPYNGKWTRTAVTKFITSLLRPIRRVTSTEELLDLMMVHDAVVVAFIDINTHPGHYRVFYQTAIKWLEKDPHQTVGFAIVTGESGKIFGVSGPLVRTYLWNGTMEYQKTTWTQANLHQWVTGQIQTVSHWLTPPGSKANTLAPFLIRGPVLLLFTPRNLQSDSIDAYTMLRQIGLEYFNCPSVNQDWIKEMSRTYIAESRRENADKHVQFLRKCEELTSRSDGTVVSDRLCQPPERPVSISFANIVNSSKLTSADYCPIGPRRSSDEYYTSSSCMTSGQYNLHHEREAKCTIVPETPINAFGDHTDHPISMLKTEFDNRAPRNLQKIAMRKKCEMHFAAIVDEDAETLFFEGVLDHANNDKILGLACKSNRTLSLIAIDSILYHTFAERLGIDVLKNRKKSAAIIVDHENESTYTLNEPINSDSIVDFVYNFTTNNLTRHLKTTAVSQSSQSFDNKGPEQSSTTRRSSRTIRLRDIDSAGFNQHVLLSNKTVVVLFYSVQCALCSIMTQSVLMTSKILTELAGQIDFVRIDGDRNDLPWQYTMEKFPSLIVFDASRKSESRIFPSSLEVTVQNVVGFVLANLNRPQRLQGLVSVCKNVQKLFPIEDCLAVLRKDTIANISVSLREWRKIPYKRGQILRRLQALQRFYLNLFRIDHSCDFNTLDTYVRDIGRVWTI